jgi:hypothetical protein
MALLVNQAHAHLHPHLRVHARTDLTHTRTRTTCSVRGQSCLPISLPLLPHTREIHLIPERYRGWRGRREAPPNLSLNPEARRHYDTAYVYAIIFSLRRSLRLHCNDWSCSAEYDNGLSCVPLTQTRISGLKVYIGPKSTCEARCMRMPGPLRAVLAVCVGNLYFLFGDKERSRVVCISEGINYFLSKTEVPELTHSRTLHTRPRLHRGRGRLNHTHHALLFSLKVHVCMWCVSQYSECEEGQCCLSFFLASLFFHCSATHSLTCSCIYPNPTSQSYPS